MPNLEHGRRATAFAPATVGNAAVGFDILGFAFPVVGDRITVTRVNRPERKVVVEAVDGDPSIPLDPARNTASVALARMIEDESLSFGFSVRVEKGLPLAAGMGGSAASAVGAVVAANALLDRPLDLATQCRYAVAGEACASGAAHADNVAPCLYGGLTLVVSHDPLDVVALPVPEGISCALVHPHMQIETKSAREVLSDSLKLTTHIAQSAYLAGFLTACFRADADLLGRSLRDVVVEPQRAVLIPGFHAVQRAALEAGALGASISGAGPSIFAWCRSTDDAERAKQAMVAAFEDAGLGSDAWVAPLGGEGARLVEVDG